MLVQEAQSLAHPCIQSGRTVLLDFARNMLAIAQPAHVRDTLAYPKDFAAVFARQAGPQQKPKPPTGSRFPLRRAGAALRPSPRSIG